MTKKSSRSPTKPKRRVIPYEEFVRLSKDPVFIAEWENPAIPRPIITGCPAPSYKQEVVRKQTMTLASARQGLRDSIARIEQSPAGLVMKQDLAEAKKLLKLIKPGRIGTEAHAIEHLCKATAVLETYAAQAVALKSIKA